MVLLSGWVWGWGCVNMICSDLLSISPAGTLLTVLYKGPLAIWVKFHHPVIVLWGLLVKNVVLRPLWPWTLTHEALFLAKTKSRFLLLESRWKLVPHLRNFPQGRTEKVCVDNNRWDGQITWKQYVSTGSIANRWRIAQSNRQQGCGQAVSQWWVHSELCMSSHIIYL